MRIVKKLIKKIYHLIWFLSAFLLFSPYVNADAAKTLIGGAEWDAPMSMWFADNTNNNLTTISTAYDETRHYYISNSIYTTGGSSGGANFNIQMSEPLVAGYTYAVTVLIGFANGLPKATTNYVCVGDTKNDVQSYFPYKNGVRCADATVYANSGGGYFAVYSGNAFLYGAITYIFTSPYTGAALTGAYNSTQPNESNHIFAGYKIEVLADNKTSLSAVDMHNILNNSGLASASSINQVQQGINQVQQEISGMQQKQDITNQKLDDIDDTLNDSTIDSSDNTINSLKNQIPTNSVISDLLLLPIRFLQNFVNALNSSCTTFSLGSLLGTNLFMPCINLENYLGSTIWTMIDLIFSGMFVYGLRKKFIQIYQNITNLKNGGNEVD